MNIQSDNPKRLLIILGVFSFLLLIFQLLQSSELSKLNKSNKAQVKRLLEARKVMRQYAIVEDSNTKENKDMEHDSLLTLLGSCASDSKIATKVSSMVPQYDKKTQRTTVKIQIKRLTMSQLLNFLSEVHSTHSQIREDRVDLRAAMQNGDWWNVYLQISAQNSIFK
jgi:hypothetical protein